MVTITLGDMAQNFIMRRQSSTLKGQAQVAAQELSTGLTADMTKHLRGDLLPITGIQASLAQMAGYRSAGIDASLLTGTFQTVLGNLGQLAGGLTNAFVTFGVDRDNTSMDAQLADADQRFSAAVSALNTRSGARTVFAGTASESPALASPATILSALDAAIASAGATTAADVHTTVADWFSSPTGFAAIGYLGGDKLAPVSISASDKTEISLTANDPVIRNTLQNLAIGALMHRGTLPAQADRVDMARRLGNAMLQNDRDRVTLQAHVGMVQGRIEQVAARNESERSALEMAQTDLLSVDGYEAATRMEAAQSQLESLYAITARLSRLSLVDFLR